MKKAQLLNTLMNSGHSRWICIWAISSVCKVYFMLAELNEVQDQLRHFCGTFHRFSGNCSVSFRVFFLSGSSNVVDVAHTGVIWGCS